MVEHNIIGWGPKPFRVLNCWFEDKRFHEGVKESWSNNIMEGWGAFVRKEKLKGVNVALKRWNLVEFGMFQRKQKQRVKDLNSLICWRNNEIWMMKAFKENYTYKKSFGKLQNIMNLC